MSPPVNNEHCSLISNFYQKQTNHVIWTKYFSTNWSMLICRKFTMFQTFSYWTCQYLSHIVKQASLLWNMFYVINWLKSSFVATQILHVLPTTLKPLQWEHTVSTYKGVTWPRFGPEDLLAVKRECEPLNHLHHGHVDNSAFEIKPFLIMLKKKL